MKDKILFLILGILIGAVITAACFLVIGKSTRKGMRDGNFKPDKEMMENFDPENFDPENLPEDMKKGRPDKDSIPEKSSAEKTSETTEAAE